MEKFCGWTVLWLMVATACEATSSNLKIPGHSTDRIPTPGYGDKALVKETRNSPQTKYLTNESGASTLLGSDVSSSSSTSWLWVLDLGDDPEYGIDLNLTSMALPSGGLHDGSSRKTYADGSFLLVGTGDTVLGNHENLFWGVRRETVSLHLTSGVGHAYLSLHYPVVYNATQPVLAFSYQRTGVPVTTLDPSLIPSTLAPPPANVSTTAQLALNGVPLSQALTSAQLSSVKEITALVGQDFVSSRNITLESDIDKDSVTLGPVMSCHPIYCWDECAAYIVSIRANFASNGSWVFTQDLLEAMFADRKYNEYWESGPIPVKVCLEEGHMDFYSLIVAGSVTGGAAVFFLVVWRIQFYYRRNQKREVFEKQQQELAKERARRSSGDISILGLGGWGDSVASRASRRLSLPFPKRRTESTVSENDGDDVSEINLYGYQEYIPDRILMDSAVLGIEADLINKPIGGSYYNDGFVDDEDDEDSLYERRPSPVTMDSDSDDPDAINFRSQSSSRKFTAPVDVHNETAL